ncbi:DUF485 domain-containing protein [Saccharopolyspora gloriosae]|uniref:DUF485 domain-containing protein n=1 Tax=Saccharopolyspora gloriosae TaxID=455344 RepID=UPI0021608C79|nr:DUF485 domain-containing protein [Saccharopolyspora gloriosae]
MSDATQTAIRAYPQHRARRRTPKPFAGIERSTDSTLRSGPDYQAIAASSEFHAIRRKVITFVFPMTALFLLWYLGYVLLAAYRTEFMAQPVFGEINIGLLMGIGQFVSTVLITTAYVRFSERFVDPRIEELRAEVDAAPQQADVDGERR